MIILLLSIKINTILPRPVLPDKNKKILDKTEKLYYCNSTVVQFQRKDVLILAIKLDKARPICPQIEEQLCIMIARGDYKPGERIMSVRDMAVEASVNPNTVQKAFEGLEAKGLLTSVRGSGGFLGENPEKATEIVNDLIKNVTGEYLKRMRELGLDTDKIIELIRSDANERDIKM